MLSNEVLVSMVKKVTDLMFWLGLLNTFPVFQPVIEHRNHGS